MIETTIIDSTALRTHVTVKTVLPEECLPQKIFVLLHGNIYPEGEFSIIENLPEELALEELCEKHHLVVVIPYMKSCYYISTELYNCDQFVARELPEWICRKYSLLSDSEKILGGISMGGYGAALIGAHTGVFRKIVSISGAYIANDVVIGNPEVWGDRIPTRESTKGSYLYYFLPLDQVYESTEKNAVAALALFLEKNMNPVFAVTCGTKDWLYPRNLTFVKKLEELGITYDFLPIDDGGHDSSCFRKGLWKAMEKIELKSLLNSV